MDNKEKFKIDKKETKELFDSAIYFVEATSFEFLTIYKNFIKKYGEENQSDCRESYFLAVGEINDNKDMRVYVRFRFHKFFNSVICFYEPTSRYVDYTLIENWIKDNYDGNPNMTDALNCHNAIFKAIEIHEANRETEGKD